MYQLQTLAYRTLTIRSFSLNDHLEEKVTKDDFPCPTHAFISLQQ